jgi:hypothetical protein
MTDATNFPSLAGLERARAEDQAWATAMFGWATHKLRRVEADLEARPPNARLLWIADDVASAIEEQLLAWEPAHRAN